MREIIDILVRRDGISYNEAALIVEECQEALDRANFYDAENIIADYLGLEPDYLIHFI